LTLRPQQQNILVLILSNEYINGQSWTCSRISNKFGAQAQKHDPPAKSCCAAHPARACTLPPRGRRRRVCGSCAVEAQRACCRHNSLRIYSSRCLTQGNRRLSKHIARALSHG
jgi:hypothetical protein